MLRNYFNIAGLNICIETEHEEEYTRFEQFRSDPFEGEDLLITLKCEKIDLTGCEVIFKDMVVTWYRRGDEFGCLFQSSEDKRNLVCFFFSADCSRATVYCEHENYMYYICGPVGEIIFRNALIQRGGMVIHASGIDYRGNGVFFSAPAGTGKTTHSNLWVEHAGASIINGDRPPILVREDGFFLCGSPWSGSSPVFENKIIPLRAMVFLARARENSVERLDARNALMLMAPRCFLPYYNKKAMGKAMDNVEKIIAGVESYLLKCTPEKEAMEKVLECIRPKLAIN